MNADSDQRVTVSQDGLAETTVILTGIDLETGYLKAITDDANREEIRLQPDGNSFDMMKGLIHQKQ